MKEITDQIITIIDNLIVSLLSAYKDEFVAEQITEADLDERLNVLVDEMLEPALKLEHYTEIFELLTNYVQQTGGLKMDILDEKSTAKLFDYFHDEVDNYNGPLN